jgi:hypothetical protein
MTSAKKVIVYRTVTDKEPFTDWLNSLRDPTIRRRILKRLLRLEQGNYGDFKPVGGGSSSCAASLALAIASTSPKTAIP